MNFEGMSIIVIGLRINSVTLLMIKIGAWDTDIWNKKSDIDEETEELEPLLMFLLL